MAEETRTARVPQLQEYRIRFRHDPFATVAGCDGKPLPEAEDVYAENPHMDGDRKIPHAEYLTYYGDPDRHVMIMADVERQCPCCRRWTDEDEAGEALPSLCGIDFMDDNPEIDALTDLYGRGTRVAAEDAMRLPGYLADVARELLGEIDGLVLPEAKQPEQ